MMISRKSLYFIFIFFLFILHLTSCGKKGNLDEKIVLAIVNGEDITLAEFKSLSSRIPEKLRAVHEQNPAGLLEQVVTRKLLLQEAKKRGFYERPEGNDSLIINQAEERAIQRLLENEIRDYRQVTEEEIARFYEENKEQMQGHSLVDVRPMIREYLQTLKAQSAFEMLVTRLHQKANIKVYEERMPKPAPPVLPPSTAEEFRSALKSGRPTLVDFGSNHCIPCIQLRPVLKALKEEYGGKINIMMLDIKDNRALAREYRIQLIPTLIFFNSEGKEVGRALGYMDKEVIKKKFQELKIG